MSSIYHDEVATTSGIRRQVGGNGISAVPIDNPEALTVARRKISSRLRTVQVLWKIEAEHVDGRIRLEESGCAVAAVEAHLADEQPPGAVFRHRDRLRHLDVRLHLLHIRRDAGGACERPDGTPAPLPADAAHVVELFEHTRKVAREAPRR
eukprot:4499322-Prymnesium_polylepis.1